MFNSTLWSFHSKSSHFPEKIENYHVLKKIVKALNCLLSIVTVINFLQNTCETHYSGARGNSGHTNESCLWRHDISYAPFCWRLHKTFRNKNERVYAPCFVWRKILLEETLAAVIYRHNYGKRVVKQTWLLFLCDQPCYANSVNELRLFNLRGLILTNIVGGNVLRR